MEVPKMMNSSPENKLSWIRSQIIGCNAEFNSPFGSRRITYADSTASGRSLRFIEDYILTSVLPFYGNTHTGDSYVGRRTTRMVEEASQYIKKCLGGGAEDAILFSGSGSTGAIKRLQEVMGIAVVPTLKDRVSQALRDDEKWVVFVGPYEHHSNLLSWRQSLAELVEIGLTQEGGSIDMEALKVHLEHYERTNRPMLGSFSACSNVTGTVTDTRALASLLHLHGAFACFDFAASGPYVDINMRSGEVDGFDAVFISPHKFIGGPGTPGILLMNKKLYQLNSLPPSTCGGGTVSYVNGFSEEDTLYLDKVEERENAGTPQITQTVRAALAFWIKEYIGYKTIKNQEHFYITTAQEKLGKNRNIDILGNNVNSVEHLAILSFLVYPTTNTTNQERNQKPLHGRFVAKLLNDLFGIQARGGCACAGPYGHYLLNVDKAYSLAIRSTIEQGYEGVKPAWTRVSFPYYMSREEFTLVLDALEFVASYGHQFLPLYDLDWKSGNWSLNETAFKKAVTGKHNTTSTEIYGDESGLAGFMRELNLRSNSKQGKGNNGASCAKDKCFTSQYASYINTAVNSASLLPKYSHQQGRVVPEDLCNTELPFMI